MDMAHLTGCHHSVVYGHAQNGSMYVLMYAYAMHNCLHRVASM